MLFSCPVSSIKQRVLQWNPWGQVPWTLKIFTTWLGLCHNTLTPARTPRLGLCHNTHTDTSKNTKAWAVSQHTDTSKKTKDWAVTTHWHQQEHQGFSYVTTHWNQQEHKTYIKILSCSAVTWGLSSAMIISSLNNSIHPLKIEINPLKMVCGCPCGGAIQKQSHVQSSHPMECSCQYTIACTYIPAEPQCSAWKCDNWWHQAFKTVI